MRKRNLFFCHLDKDNFDEENHDGRRMNTRSGTNKRRKLRDQEEIIKMKDEIVKGIEASPRFSKFMEYIKEIQSPE